MSLFGRKNNKSKPLPVNKHLTLSDANSFLKTLEYVSPFEIVAGFTRLFYHIEAQPETNSISLAPNINQAEIFSHLALHFTESSCSFLTESIERIDDLTQFKPLYSKKIKQELVGLAFDLKNVSAYQAQTNRLK